MIQPQELRIGNYFINHKWRWEQVISIEDNNSMSVNGLSKEMISPIPIRTEILDKIEEFFVDDMNYNPDKENYCMCVYEGTYLHIDSKTGVTRIGSNEHSADVEFGTLSTTFYIQETKYLHQLQNLIYSLSGCELTFKTINNE